MSARGCARCRDGVPHEPSHGITGYQSCGCRCGVCAAEWRQHCREAKRRQRARQNSHVAGLRSLCGRCGIALGDRCHRSTRDASVCRDCYSVVTAGGR